MKQEINRLNYGQKKVFVGIDVHKRTFSLVAICEDVVVKKWSMLADVADCVRALKRFFEGGELFTVYEAGFSGFSLHRALLRDGIANIVISPASVQKSPNDRVKTDLLDARKMASQLSKGLLRGIEVPSEERELKREITRLRSQLVDHRVSVTLQIKSKLHYYGLMKAEDNRKVSEKYLAELEHLELPQELRISMNILIEQWRHCSNQIKEVEKEIRKQEQEDTEVTRIYKSVPGVGTITARILANELGNLKLRFKNERELFSYTGLTPTEYSSGDSVRKGKISRCGPARIRWILTEAAWMCIRSDSSLKEAYERVKHRRGAKIAIVGIARKLIGRIRSCFIQGCTYEIQNQLSLT
jgi:transposase